MVAEDSRIAALEALRGCERGLALSRFAASFAHELGTPLNVIAGHAAMMASGELQGEAALKSAKKIAEQATRMTDMIRRALRQTDLGSIQKSALPLAPLVAEALAIVQPQSHKVTIAVDALEGPAIVLADRGRLLAALVAILENALEAMPEGGSLTVAMSQETLMPPQDVGAVKTAYLCLSITDSGVGIAPDRLGDIFRAFYTSKDTGTGLGLPLAQAVVRDHGGFIGAQSAAGQGSTFKICLPQGEKT